MLAGPLLVSPTLLAAAALLLLALLAAGVAVGDAVRSPHWRVVASERRRSWSDRTGEDFPR